MLEATNMCLVNTFFEAGSTHYSGTFHDTVGTRIYYGAVPRAALDAGRIKYVTTNYQSALYLQMGHGYKTNAAKRVIDHVPLFIGLNVQLHFSLLQVAIFQLGTKLLNKWSGAKPLLDLKVPIPNATGKNPTICSG